MPLEEVEEKIEYPGEINTFCEKAATSPSLVLHPDLTNPPPVVPKNDVALRDCVPIRSRFVKCWPWFIEINISSIA